MVDHPPMIDYLLFTNKTIDKQCKIVFNPLYAI